MSEAVFRARVLSSLPPLLRTLETFLNECEPLSENRILYLPEEEVRAMCHCLFQLGLTEDGNQVAGAWRTLNAWMFGPVFDEILAKWAADKPEESQRLRETLGAFPSVEELATSVQERRVRDYRMIQIAQRLFNQLQQVQAAFSGSVEAPFVPRVSDTPAKTIANREDERKHQVRHALACLLTIGPNALRIANEVGVPRTTLLGWTELRERYDQMKAESKLAKGNRRRGRRAGRDFEVDEG